MLLNDHLSIHVLELAKWQKPDTLQPEDNWLYFFKEGKQFKSLPPELKQLPQMREAMSVLNAFSDQSEDYYRYKTRQQILRIQLSDKSVAEDKNQKLAEAAAKSAQDDLRVKQAKGEAEQAKGEIEQTKIIAAKEKDLRLEEQRKAQCDRAAANKYKAMLQKAGIDPDSV